MAHVPRVSVGVPTCNRPLGLRRTLEQILNQTYTDIEVLVSDNASTDPEVWATCLEFSNKDSRVKANRQSTNVGVHRNFISVLQNARGEYFMWAADDDEWEPTFIEECVRCLDGGAMIAMTYFSTLHRPTGVRTVGVIPNLSEAHSKARNMAAFLRRPAPSMFYGLYQRAMLSTICIRQEWFDYFDCYCILAMMKAGKVSIVPRYLFTSGIDQVAYVIKPMGRRLRFLPFCGQTCAMIRGGGLPLLHTLALQVMTIITTIRFFLSHLRVSKGAR